PLFFKRCLVVHVDLSLLVWFYAFIAALAALRAPRSGVKAARIWVPLVVAGVLAMLAGGLVPGAGPVPGSCIPVMDHPLFLGGLGMIFAGFVGAMLGNLLASPGGEAGGLPQDAAQGVLAAAVAVVLAAATWISARAGMPGGLDAWTHHEFSAWGAGHVL